MKLRILSLILIVFLMISGCTASSGGKNEVSVPDAGAVFHFIDVGQGDCTLIQTSDTVILIDAGTAEAGSRVYNYLKDNGVKQIDCFILTHPHEDHMGGAATVLSGIDVGTIFVSADTSDSYFYERFLDVVLDKNINMEFPDMDCVYDYGSVRVKFLSPKTDYGDLNQNCLVTMIEVGNTKALFMGDAERIVEKTITEEYNIKADILKVGHHGSRNGTSYAFLNEVLPAVSVIQCGKDNSYGHPHKEALDRLKKTNSQILRCDKDGDIILKTDGNKIYDENDIEIKSNASAIDFNYIGNKKSKVFHTEECPNLPGSKNSIIFKDRSEAVNKGYKPCGNCNP